jgi:hypothetical protein
LVLLVVLRLLAHSDAYLGFLVIEALISYSGEVCSFEFDAFLRMNWANDWTNAFSMDSLTQIYWAYILSLDF